MSIQSAVKQYMNRTMSHLEEALGILENLEKKQVEEYKLLKAKTGPPSGLNGTAAYKDVPIKHPSRSLRDRQKSLRHLLETTQRTWTEIQDYVEKIQSMESLGSDTYQASMSECWVEGISLDIKNLAETSENIPTFLEDNTKQDNQDNVNMAVRRATAYLMKLRGYEAALLIPITFEPLTLKNGSKPQW